MMASPQPVDPARVLGHDLRFEGAGPITRHVEAHLADLGADRLGRAAVTLVRRPGRRRLAAFIAEVVGHLGL
jgi:hypothetical protein